MNTNFLDLTKTNWGEVKDRQYDMVLLPWGAIEPHNYHLPYITDAILTYEIARECAREAFTKANVMAMVMPPIYLGSQNPGQWEYPFCIHTNYETQKAILTDIVKSLHGQGLRKMVIINGHGGNSFKAMIRDLAVVFPDFYIVSSDWYTFVPRTGYFDEKIDDHAGEQETSVMMYFHPELVDLNTAGDGTPNPMKLKSIADKTGWMPRNWKETTEDTGIGNPKKSTAQKGEIYVKEVVSRITDLLTELKNL